MRPCDRLRGSGVMLLGRTPVGSKAMLSLGREIDQWLRTFADLKENGGCVPYQAAALEFLAGSLRERKTLLIAALAAEEE